MKRIVILISGRGSNMAAVADACAREQWQAEVVAVVSSRSDAQGLQLAGERGIAATCVDHRGYPDRATFEAALSSVP